MREVLNCSVLPWRRFFCTLHRPQSLERVAVAAALQGGFVKPGQPVVITAGLPFHVAGTTNLIKGATAEWS